MNFIEEYWQLYDVYVQTGFADLELAEQINSILIQHANTFLLFKRSQSEGSKVVALRAQYDRIINLNLKIKCGDIALLDYKYKKITLVSSSLKWEWVTEEFAKIPVVEKNKALWLPMVNEGDVSRAVILGQLSKFEYMRWSIRQS